VVCSRLRGEKRLAVAVAKFIKATITSKIGEITVSHGNAPSFVIKVVEAIREELPEARIYFGTDWRVGLTIQAHGGPTSLHINYHRKPETNSLASTKEILDSII
jgi:predicted TIM-barrel fold metal-dependent hydrolase